jgi:hypothetical protein
VLADTLAEDKVPIPMERQNQRPTKPDPKAKPPNGENQPDFHPHGVPPAASHDEPKGTPNSDRHRNETVVTKAKP